MSGRRVALAIYVEHGNEPKVTYAMDSLKRAMRWDEEAYGREYDLDIFMIVAVSAFNFGAMENKGLNIFNDKLLLASPETATDDDYARIESVVAHEYFHNWTGNRITCRDWFQLSLKEGLTVFRDQSFSADMRSKAVKRIEDVKMLRMRQFQEDAGPLAHPVQPDAYITIDNFYTATVYEKGAEIIGMLKTLVGDEGYRKATDLYFARHDGEAATVEDWVKCFEDANARDLSQFRLWYHQSGTPVVEAKGAYDAANQRYTLTLRQTLAPSPGQPSKKPMPIPVRLGFVGRDGRALPLTLQGENMTGPDERVLELTQSRRELRLRECSRRAAALGRPRFLGAREFQAFARPQSARGADGTRQRRFQPLGSGPGAGDGCAPRHGRESESRCGTADGQHLSRRHRRRAGARRRRSGLRRPDAHAAAGKRARARADAGRSRCDPYGTCRPHPRHRRHARSALQRSMEIRTYRRLLAGCQSRRRRSLRNAALRYLTAADDDAAAALADAHYRAASNMTDMIAGLAALSRMNSPLRDSAFAHFHDRFRGDPLVLDKWLGLQAGSPCPTPSPACAR